MKILFKTSVILLVFLIASSCNAQSEQVRNDLNKLNTNKQEFLNKPLKTLLQQIEPEIKSVLANPASGYIKFFFDSLDNVMKSDYKVSPPLYIQVYIKEPFTWEGRGKYFYLWTKKDEEKYGNLTISYIKIRR